MNDYLVQMGQNKTTKKISKNLGLSLPQKLLRISQPWQQSFIASQTVALGGRGHMHLILGEVLTRAGAFLNIVSDDEQVVAAYRDLNQVKIHGDKKLIKPTRAMVFDATAIDHPDELVELYEFVHQNIRRLETNGRMVVLANTPQAARTPQQAAASEAIEGFVRSLAKELGRKGATANLVANLDDSQEAKERAVGVLLFLLSPRSAFVSGQSLTVSAAVAAGPWSALSWHQPLKGKTALVTGAARGIGKATAVALAREGAQVICLDRPQDEKLVAEAALETGGKVLLVDLSDAKAATTVTQFVASHTTGLDIVVHNAGITRDKTIANMDDKLWDQVMAVNLAAVMKVTEALLVAGANPGAHFVCLSSIAGIAGNFGQTNYAAAKSGILGYVRFLAAKIADRGMTINAVAPGFIETRLTADIPFFTREVARRLCNLSQGGLPADVAEAITFLASPQAAGLTGQTLRVCGGSLVGR